MSADWLADLAFLVTNATAQELERHEGDTMMKKHRRGQMIGVQGRILDAMDDGHITPMDARKLLCKVQQRRNGRSAGLCRVTDDGDLIAIGSVQQEEHSGI